MPGARIRITGIVQGVGMRPFVYREAVAHAIAGWVLNAGDGVHIEAWGSEEDLAGFVRDLSAHAPAAARVDDVSVEEIEGAPTCEVGAVTGEHTEGGGAAAPVFRIVASADDTAHTTLVSPDIATCPDCLRELFDPADRRFRYPFINCTNCGPRFTIIGDLPYDRPKTSMAPFPMCPTCAAEYGDPLDRRFHAQPDACFSCGPHLTWREPGDAVSAIGRSREKSDAIIGRCARALATGGIVAIKGLGGFHLACDAGNEDAVRELRRRKRRSNKALAVMMARIEDAAAVCHVGETERALLEGPIRPIVLLRRRAGEGGANVAGADSGSVALAPSVAFDLPELGVMLPYTPLQHLLLAACSGLGVLSLVMTSGNVSEEPIETDDALAWEHLVESGVADALLGNDRAILSRYDDSVVRAGADGAPLPVRRARGYAPQPLALPACPDPAQVLACGPEQKATIALTRDDQCFLSQHIGDVENGATLEAWHEARRRMEGLFAIEPSALACDLHPSYLSSQWARAEAARRGQPLVEVQHHHAHIASVIAEAQGSGALAPGESVIGLAFDGTGAGTDGTVWGGEVLVADLTGFARVGHLVPWPLPGGAASVRDPRRNALSLLLTCGLADHPGAAPLRSDLGGEARAITARMVERRINSPITSSMGRLLDALAALCGICGQATYEGEPAIRFEAAAQRWAAAHSVRLQDQRYRFGLSVDAPCSLAPDEQQVRERAGERPAAAVAVADPTPLVEAVLSDLAAERDAGEVSWLVHQSVIALAAEFTREAARETGTRVVALSGGVFMNRLLLEGVSVSVANAGMTPLIPHSVPVNDGCIAYGQAAVARARLQSCRA
ncbi:MAG: carbamoyltransferase HypF [Coriobacteriaceae bacterium]|nr:carbamoyltransferase HypF [Coriobacteriaceae bacterium]